MGRHRRDPARRLRQLAGRAHRPGPAARALGDVRGHGPVVGGADPDEHPPRGIPRRAPAVPRASGGAVLHPPPAQLGGHRHHLQGPPRPQLRPRRRAAHPAAGPGLAGEARARHGRDRLRGVMAVHPVPHPHLPGRRTPDPEVDVRGGPARRRRPGPHVLPDHPAPAEVHDHHLVDPHGRRVAGVLRPHLRPHRGRAWRQHPSVGPGDVQAGLPGEPDGSGQRHRRHPGGPRPGLGPPPATDRRRQLEHEPAGRGLTWPPRCVPGPVRPWGAGSAARAAAARTAPTGGAAGWLWLLIVIVPIYWIVITSFKTQSNYFAMNPLAPPTEPTLDNYKLVIENDFIRYFVNSTVVTLGAVVPAVLVSFMAAYAIVRAAGAMRALRWMNSLFLMGLAIPLQAAIIPVYLIVIRLHMYDSLLAIILPSIAFAIPLSVLVLTNFIRDVPKELFDSMRVDGASEWGTLRHLAFPLTRPALVTVSIYNGLAIWNGFLLPLILTQSPSQRTLPLALWSFQGEFSINVPAVLASVVLTTLPILALYAIGRRQLLSGLTAGFSK